MSEPYFTFNGAIPQFYPAQPVATSVIEKSTLILSVAAFDENGSATVASGVVWSLTDEDGTPINARSDVSVPGSGSAFSIVFSGLDTLLETLKADGTSDDGERIVVVKGFYNSPSAGNGLSIVGKFLFRIVPIPPSTVT